MNELEKAIKRNDSARLLETTSRMHRNCIRINTNNSFAHEAKKLEICYALKSKGQEFVCEAEFKGKKGRADVFILDDCVAIELLESEKQESIQKKRQIYPCRIVDVIVDKPFKEEMIK
jgi:hypothetical protein